MLGDPQEPCVQKRRPRLLLDADEPELDLKSPVMHTSGTCLFSIVAVLTLHPQGTTWQEASTRVTRVTEEVTKYRC